MWDNLDEVWEFANTVVAPDAEFAVRAIRILAQVYRHCRIPPSIYISDQIAFGMHIVYAHELALKLMLA